MDSSRVDALLLAAGASRRMGGSENKVFLPLAAASVVSWSLLTLEHCPQIRAIHVTIRNEDHDRMASEIERWGISKARGKMIAGGEERFHSVRNGLEAMAAEDPPDLVVIHDGARPFLEQRLIEDSIRVASTFGAAVVGHPMVDTAKEISGTAGNPLAVRTLDRQRLWQVQTPQSFRFSLILEGYRKWDESRGVPTDDAAVAEMAGCEVYLVRGNQFNLKITTDLDLRVARALAEQGIWSIQ